MSIWPTDPHVFENVFDASPSALMALDGNGRIVAANRAAARLTGRPQASLLTLPFTQIANPPAQDFVTDALRRAGAGETTQSEIELSGEPGQSIPIEVASIPVSSGEHLARIILRLEDISERRSARSRLRTLAFYDSLTGLANRTLLQERLRDAIEAGNRCAALLLFDLDRFKDINETLGHALGDRFLQLVAERLTSLAGEGDLVARFAGNEFAVLVPRCSGSKEVREFADRLLKGVDQSYRIEGFEQYITTSIGIALFPRDGRDDQVLIKNADIALSRAKQQGRNTFVFYDKSLEEPIRRRLAQEKQLRNALARGEFVLQYQPIMHMRDHKRAFGVEALVRWNHPKDGLLFPDSFIPAAEASGIIVQLGQWVQETAITQMRTWQDRYGFFTLALNISAREFSQRDLCHRLMSIAHRAGLPPEAIAVEITESMALFDAEHAVETITELKRAGAQIAIDDFGTGHSSLHYLRRIEIDHIKIDRSFISGIGVKSSDETIIKAIIAMGHSLGHKVIAEGVEQTEQYDFLEAQGCDLVQGNLLAAPMDPQALGPVLVASRA